MGKLSKKDFDYYKSIIKEDEQEQHHQLMCKNLPHRVITAYEGLLFSREHDREQLEGLRGHGAIQPKHGFDHGRGEFDDAEDQIENWLGIAADTVIPGLYYQIPMPNIKTKPGGSEFTAEIFNGLARHYFDEKAKKENQACILDAYLAYGIGIMKVGYNSRVGILKNKRSNLFSGEVKADGKDTDMESSAEYVKYERPFVERQSPMTTYLDWSKGFGKGQRVTFEYDRNLQEIIDSNLYTIPSRFIQHFSAKSSDNRQVKIKIKETWILINGYAHKLVHTRDWPEEIAFNKTQYQWLPIELLRFKNPPDTLYPRPHGAQAAAAQHELNYQNALWKEHIDKLKKQTIIDTTGLTENGKKTLKQNKIGAVVEANRPVNAVVAEINSTPMSSDVFSNIANVRGYLQQILSAGGAVSGDVSADTATQERGVQLGNFLRTSGMQDSIRDFNVGQLRKMITCIVNWGDPQVTVAITKKNVVDPATGEIVTGKNVLIGGDRGLSIQEEIIGNLESDYEFDMDMANAARPDFAVVRKQLMEFATIAAELKPAVNNEGNEINITEILKDIANTFDTLPNPGKYIRPLTPEEQEAQAQQAQIAQQQEFLKNASEPTEEAIVRGAESTGMAEGTI